jgi:hypothetical protein
VKAFSLQQETIQSHHLQGEETVEGKGITERDYLSQQPSRESGLMVSLGQQQLWWDFSYLLRTDIECSFTGYSNSK